MSSTDTIALPGLQTVFKSLEWVDGVTFDLTGLPDAFVSLLTHCSEISRDKDNANARLVAAYELLDITEPAKSKYDADGPDVLRNAIMTAIDDSEFASLLASMCDTYYFLRSLDGFSLDEKSFSDIVKLLRLDETAAPNAESTSETHATVIDSLNAYLDKLETRYPGIKQFANCVMLEANIAQEFGTGYEHLYNLRSELPSDGKLYVATLHSIVDSVQKNLDTAHMIAAARSLYQDENAEYWSVVCNTIWELQNGSDADHDYIDDDNDDYYYDFLANVNLPKHASSASGRAASGRKVGLVAN
ncbi:hypothetical protein LPJ73_005871 [Coemansia sp. RSA 2703]|nr:hypothetical protein LPJ73_005871 [Coemansia sp. RSA 2703]KAJ2375508.1 hypothetical protein IW150_002514 [Coemansia sp. RSA 2607]